MGWEENKDKKRFSKLHLVGQDDEFSIIEKEIENQWGKRKNKSIRGKCVND